MNHKPKVSIIIPLYDINERFFRDFKKYDLLNYPNYEIIVVCDKKVTLPKLKNCRVSLILTNKKKTGPAEKRDVAINNATGSICAFIDDDAYPDINWVKNAITNFQCPQVAAVGGPGLTPKEDNNIERLTGLVYSSFFCGGFAQYRFVKGKKQFVDDYPAYNLLARKDVLKKVGGYGTHFYGGEDTFLCLKIIKVGWKIIYDPSVVVFHHRRPLFLPYLKQIANIGKHRGYFAKRYPETSRTLTYFLPSFLMIGFFTLLIIGIFNKSICYVFGILNIVFLSMGTLSVLKEASLLNGMVVAIGIILTHLVYGVSFLRGLLITNLKR